MWIFLKSKVKASSYGENEMAFLVLSLSGSPSCLSQLSHHGLATFAAG